MSAPACLPPRRGIAGRVVSDPPQVSGRVGILFSLLFWMMLLGLLVALVVWIVNQG